MLTELEPLGQELAENRRMLDQVLGRLKGDDRDRPPRESEYSPRQVLAHLAGAERGMTRLMRSMAAGERPRLKPDYDNDFYNARQQEKRARMTLAEVRAELDESRRDLLIFMQNLQPEDLGRTGEHPTIGETSVLGVLKRLQSHEREHIAEMGSWVDELVGGRV